MIHARAEWTTRAVPNPAPARNVPFGFLHHEGGGVRGIPADKAAVLRQIEANVLGKGYTAIDYNLMVFNDGDVWEGRGEQHEDGATLHHNADGLSVCAVGNYQTEPASDALIRGIGVAFAHAIQTGWLRRDAGIEGHRQVFQTACPGTNLFARMGDVRVAITQALTGTPTPLPEEDVEHGMAVDTTINPAIPTRGYVLSRWGSIHPFGGALPTTGGPSWQGKDVARRIIVTDWTKPAGYILDLDGALHPFGGAPPLAGTPYWKGGKIVDFTEV